MPMMPATVKMSAMPRSGPVPNQPPIQSAPRPSVMNGMNARSAIGPMAIAITGDAAFSTICANPNTRPWRSKGIERCRTVCSLFTLQHSIVMLTIGTYIWVLMMPVIEAAEQTVLQRSIPFERQGRVFGFAQLVENAAAPLTAFLMAPLAARVFMPFMTDGRGADWIGGWFGTGPERGIALIFTVAGIIGIIVTLLAFGTRSYRRLVTVVPATA